MKKTFVNPEMNISLFETENILTAVSGGTNLTSAEAALNTAGATATNITEINFGDIRFGI